MKKIIMKKRNNNEIIMNIEKWRMIMKEMKEMTKIMKNNDNDNEWK